MGAAIAEGMGTPEALLFGRRTCQAMAAAWPDRPGDPNADQMNAIKKYVLSGSLTQDELTWNNTSLLSSLTEIGALRKQHGGDLLVWGSSKLVTALISLGQVDELNLMIEPVLFGWRRASLSRDGVARAMQLVRCTTARTGVQVCTYRPAS